MYWRAYNGSLPFALCFDDGDVAVQRQVDKALGLTARLGPRHLQPIDRCPFADTKNYARIVIGKVAAAAYFHSRAPEVLRLVGDSRAHRVRV